MEQNKKTLEKESLFHFFPVTESASSKQNRMNKKSGMKQKTAPSATNKFANDKTLINKMSPEKAVYATQTQEISFEEFLKSKPKKP